MADGLLSAVWKPLPRRASRKIPHRPEVHFLREAIRRLVLVGTLPWNGDDVLIPKERPPAPPGKTTIYFRNASEEGPLPCFSVDDEERLVVSGMPRDTPLAGR